MSPSQLTSNSNSQKGHEHRVIYWLLLSLGLHTLFMLWPIASEFPDLQWQTINVVLHSPQVQPTPDKTPPSMQRSNTAKSAPHPKQAIATTPVPTPSKPATKQQQATPQAHTEALRPPVTETSNPAPTTVSSPPNQQALLAMVQLALQRYFHYPSMAKRRGWQGEVRLGFELNSEGKILGAHIAHSSGYSMLDRAALGSLQQIGAIDARLSSTQQMELHVIYRLQEG